MRDENIAELRLASPGLKLRAAREAKKWPIEEVASKLNLSSQRIAELEADDYRLMPGLPYIRGYLRSYARLVGVEEAEIIQQLDALGIKEERKKSNIVLPPNVEQQRVPVNTRALLWISLLILFVLISVVSMWFGHHDNDQTPSNTSVQTVITPKATN